MRFGWIKKTALSQECPWLAHTADLLTPKYVWSNRLVLEAAVCVTGLADFSSDTQLLSGCLSVLRWAPTPDAHWDPASLFSEHVSHTHGPLTLQPSSCDLLSASCGFCVVKLEAPESFREKVRHLWVGYMSSWIFSYRVSGGQEIAIGLFNPLAKFGWLKVISIYSIFMPRCYIGISIFMIEIYWSVEMN